MIDTPVFAATLRCAIAIFHARWLLFAIDATRYAAADATYADAMLIFMLISLMFR